MIEVIKEGHKRFVTCGNCGAELRYDNRTDPIDSGYFDGFLGISRYILTCPCCKKEINLGVIDK